MTDCVTESEDEKSTIEFDNIFGHVSSLGRYQKQLYFFTSLLLFPVTTQFTLLVFAFGTPGFHCVTPNVTCDPKKCCDGCTSYEFDGTFHSTVSEILTGVPSAFVHSIPLFMVLRFMVGFSVVGVYLSQYIFVMELVGPSKRTAAGNLAGLFHNSFQASAVLISYFLRDWRMLILAFTVPAVLLFPFWRVFPESPRWLVAHDRLDEAQSVIEAFGGKENKPVNSEVLRALLEDVRRDQLERERQTKKYTPIDLFRSPKLRKWTAIMCYQWFTVALVSFGIFIFVSQLVGDIHVNYLIMKGVAVLKLPVAWYFLLKFGRRIVHAIIMILVGITFLLVLLLYKDHPMATTVLSVCGYNLIDCTWTSVYLITSELYPTVLRNTGQGTASTSAQIGGILAPYVALMLLSPWSQTLAGILMYWIPETLFSPMHQTIEEAEGAKDDYGIPCCGKTLTRRRKGVAEENDAVKMDDMNA
ncbi:hypothetical protein OS493_037390 [Desmophyllum pertusum]|uniref:Uncharacterized protein n=1 Tax=Desmophyllum pertusum TaxID=174260 RepID=A0A9W9ZVY8_9CNID|nr:hypothetical protein OS493_037390 [Desmophyllum pertusum]